MRLRLLASACFLLCSFTAAHADSIGNSVSCAVLSDPYMPSFFSCDKSMATVGSGIEFNIGTEPYPTNALQADFTADGLNILLGVFGDLRVTILSFRDLTSEFTSATLLSTAGISGLDASRIALKQGLLTIDLRKTTITPGGSINLSLSTSPTPEPSSFILFGTGALAAAGALRRRCTA